MKAEEFARKAEQDQRLMELVKKYDEDPNSLTDHEFDEMLARFDRIKR